MLKIQREHQRKSEEEGPTGDGDINLDLAGGFGVDFLVYFAQDTGTKLLLETNECNLQ